LPELRSRAEPRRDKCRHKAVQCRVQLIGYPASTCLGRFIVPAMAINPLLPTGGGFAASISGRKSHALTHRTLGTFPSSSHSNFSADPAHIVRQTISPRGANDAIDSSLMRFSSHSQTRAIACRRIVPVYVELRGDLQRSQAASPRRRLASLALAQTEHERQDLTSHGVSRRLPEPRRALPVFTHETTLGLLQHYRG
jgi:hypothetical protein